MASVRTKRTYTPQTTAGGAANASATFEFGDDTQEYECEYCEATGFTLGFERLTVGQAAPLALNLNYHTQSLTSNTKTASLAAIRRRSHCPHGRCWTPC